MGAMSAGRAWLEATVVATSNRQQAMQVAAMVGHQCQEGATGVRDMAGGARATGCRVGAMEGEAMQGATKASSHDGLHAAADTARL